MRKHRPVVREDQDGRFYATCSCRQYSGPRHFLVRQEAEDWVFDHLIQVQRALAHLRRGRGTLAQERDHARKMLDDPDTPSEEKALWEILYHGAVSRIGQKVEIKPEEEGLW